jgi:two-component system, OmpR family, phosphate regulon sensor histidine kinase PhoR
VILDGPIFRKLLWSAFLPTLATLLVLNFYLTRYTAQRQVGSIEQRLNTMGRILADEVSTVPIQGLGDWVKRSGDRAQVRVTVIDPGGVVLADSQHDAETLANQSGRPEIVEARQRSVGTSIRHSAIIDRDLYHWALQVEYHNQPGHILLLAEPLDDLDAATAAVRWRILGASFVAAVLALIIAYFFAQSLTHRIGALRAFAEGLIDARFSEKPLPEADDELGALARSLNQMASQSRELLARLSLESVRREAILASMVEGVLAVDQDLRVTFCNDSFASLAGATHPIPAGTPLVDLLREPELLQMLSEVLATGTTRRRRQQLPAAEGRWFEVQTAALAMPMGRGAIAILHEVTDLERLERVRKDFVANVSHELRTPLTAIRGYAETLLDGALEDPENNRKFLQIIQAHAIRLNNIASDLLTLSELESGRSEVEPECVSVRSSVEAALRAVEPEARVRSVRLIAGPIEDAEVLGYKVRLEQALVNLLDNAVKFNRAGGEVRVEAGLGPNQQAYIRIADTGIGIPSEDLSRVFERFYRVDRTRSREVGGTGLGLSIVKHVIERMRGTITVESLLGKGSSFTVTLPSADRTGPSGMA